MNKGTRSEVFASNGMAAASQPLATEVAIDILNRGGSAVDAAIAANVTLGVVEPTGCGIGGDLFAIVWDSKSQKLFGLNGSGKSPSALTLDVFRDREIKKIPMYGPLTVTVPGCVDGWFELHNRFGKLPIQALFAQAIYYATNGFHVTEVISKLWENGKRSLADQPNFAATFLPGGNAPKKGDIFKNPDLAKTYEFIVKDGRDGFYKGIVANTIQSFAMRVGCYLRTSDLENHSSKWVEPLSSNYRGNDVWQLPPNTHGISVLQMLNILEGFHLKEMGHNSVDYLHHLTEVKKIVFEDRAKYYADPEFANVPVKSLISKKYAENCRSLVRPDSARHQIELCDPKLFSGDTVYLCTADKEGNMVSLIQSNWRGFGSGLVPDGLGFVLQNRGELFSLDESSPNVYAPCKRPFHTIIPGFVTKGSKPWLCFGVMGGDMQPQGQVQILCNLIDFGMNLQQASDAPRIHHYGSSEPTGVKMINGGKLALENGIPVDVQQGLINRGHDAVFESQGFGGFQGIMIDPCGGYIGASDHRKDGYAAGY